MDVCNSSSVRLVILMHCGTKNFNVRDIQYEQ